MAGLLLGLVWAVWHLPLLFTEGRALDGQPFWLLLFDLAAKSVLFACVFLRTRGSVLVAVLLHAKQRLRRLAGGIGNRGPDVAAHRRRPGWVLAALVLVRARPSLARPVSDPEVIWPAGTAPDPARPSALGGLVEMLGVQFDPALLGGQTGR